MAFSFADLNPLAQLQKQLDEIYMMITLSQNILEEVAGAAERVAGILSWEEPRVTAVAVAVLLVIAWCLIYVEAVTRFIVTFVIGVVFKTIFAIISPSTIKFGVSCGILFVLRHPAILPDGQTQAIQAEKKKQEMEAAAAAESSNSVSEAPPPPPPPAPTAILDPRPLPPVNIFLRMPTQQDRIMC